MDRKEQIEKIDEEIEKVTTKLNDPNLCRGTLSTQTRVSGYYRDVQNFNVGKQQEFTERSEYKL